ncbi:DUF2752 domain-containing protein [Nocardioides daeguensis]|uniref:DUF2752 domain-containing protein n=1 Tax=Nocardioides daeguensis TaxID=908359 RepID=A0ABP6USL7_9ACTN|nr:DUF2752 domain-containing protein [Nocardioides daeguensis]MBV6725653.1 DUF2752 domain-containing protein [Nocardioides daeguensis]MCR1772832.1 DUF2752 domain-containing protein [Nocardioides daeguensis]
MTLAADPVRTAAPARWRRMVPPAAVVGGLAAASLALHLRDPHEQGSWGLCPSAAVGISCPGCGGLRAVNDLSNLQIGAAASSNLLFVASLPFVLYALARWTHGRWTGRPWAVPAERTAAGTWVVLVVMALFAVVRNTPAGSWLAP